MYSDEVADTLAKLESRTALWLWFTSSAESKPQKKLQAIKCFVLAFPCPTWKDAGCTFWLLMGA